MLQNIKELYGNALAASDGDIGHVRDFYFDDQAWAVRYLVADTGTWLVDQLVLLSPHSFGRLDRDKKILHVKLTKKQIEGSPSIETHRPVSRQYEEDYYRYYGWSGYWNGEGIWGASGYPIVTGMPVAMPPLTQETKPHHGHNQRDDLHLRSTKAVTGYSIQATDGVIGSVSSFLVDDKSWEVGEFVVETGHWFSGKEILIAPNKIERISYEDSKVFVKLTMADIKRTAENEVAKSGG
jgi:uncharacterized protein YrrD